MSSLRDLIDYPDLDACLLAASAVAELPEVTPLLVLADRFAEREDHDRERLTRRLAAAVTATPKEYAGFGEATQGHVLSFITPAEARLAVWLAMWTTPYLTTPLSVRAAALAVLRLCRPDTGHALPVIDPPSGEVAYRLPGWRPRLAVDLLRHAAVSLCRPGTPHRAAILTVRATQVFGGGSQTAVMHARHRLAGCVELATARPLPPVMARARACARTERARRRREWDDICHGILVNTE